jgi:hypothetical protein
VPEADPGMMPPMMCHPKMGPAMQWTNESKTMERHCPYFSEIETEEVNQDEATGDNAGVQDYVNVDDYTAKQLRAIADEYGVEYKNGATKKHLVRLINEHIASLEG